MSTTTKQIKDTIAAVNKLDLEWQKNPAGRDDPRSLPWRPFPWPDFIALLAEALPEAPGERFLDVGAGVGTKMLLADSIFGLNTQGIERVPEYVRQARELGLVITEADALTWDGYGDFDIVWLNRPFKDEKLQAELERQVQAGMKSGAVFIGVNLVSAPSAGWWLVLDDMELHRGIWQKP